MNEYMTKEMEQIKIMIAQTVAKREALKLEMKEWYDNNGAKKFLKLKDLIVVDKTLSELDTHYKRLWDQYNLKKAV
ncbi:hypothetical protein KJ877_02130 [bacterium]|nr:hypothetical protein [bacterium]